MYIQSIEIILKIMYSYATYKNSQSRLKERSYYSELGGLIDIGLLSENHHKSNLVVSEDLLLNEGVVPLLWVTSYITLIIG